MCARRSKCVRDVNAANLQAKRKTATQGLPKVTVFAQHSTARRAGRARFGYNDRIKEQPDDIVKIVARFRRTSDIARACARIRTIRDTF